MKIALYFGCINEPGHYLFGARGSKSTLRPQSDYPGFPWTIAHLDGGLLENGQEPDRETGRVRWTCGGRPTLWFAFYWWDRSVDGRPASNSGFYVSGFEIGEQEQAFEYACKQWPKVVSRQRHGLTLVHAPHQR